MGIPVEVFFLSSRVQLRTEFSLCISTLLSTLTKRSARKPLQG